MGETIRDALLSEYESWQSLGQGEKSWDRPVSPEPYFYPFLGHGALVKSAAPVDDGRRETLLSKLASLFRPHVPPPPQVETEWDFLKPLCSREPPPFLGDARTSLFQAEWRLPRKVKWDPRQWESLLFSLSSASHPVCLEFAAAGGTVVMRWIVADGDRRVLEDSMSSAGIGLHSRPDPLNQWLEGNDGFEVAAVELALAKGFCLPIRTEFRADPYETVLSALGSAGDGGLAAVQVLFSPCANPWAEGIWKSVTTDEGRPFFQGGEPQVRAAREKCSLPLFAACVRIFALSDSADPGGTAARIARSFDRFEGRNGFVVADGNYDDAETAVEDMLLRRFRRSGMILNAAELFALVHIPSEGVGSPYLKRMDRNTRGVPPGLAAHGDLLLGVNEHLGEHAECRVTPESRCRHTHVIGASGTGKSTFLLHSMVQDMEQGNGFALLDPHGDLVEAVLDRLPAHRIGDLVLFDPSDTEWPVGFNILRAHSDSERNLLASDFVSVFERLSSSWGDQMTAVLGNAAMAFLESERGGTLLDLKRFLIEKPFRERFLRTVRDSEVRYFWTHEFPLLRGATQSSLITRLNGFLRHRLVRNMVAQNGEQFDVARMMDEGKIVLAPLAQGLIGQENSWLLGSLLVSRFHQAALARQSVGESERRPFYLYLDEAHNFVTPSIAAILSGARKYGLGLVLAHQELDQFSGSDGGVLGSILTNCHTRVYFRPGDRDAERLEGGFDHFEAEDLRRLSVGEAVCRIGGSGNDFNLSFAPSPPLTEGAAERRANAIERSRNEYASPRAEAERLWEREEPVIPIPETKPRRSSAERQLRTSESLSDAQPAEPESMVSIDPAPTNERKVTTPGRGGSRHKQLQQMIKCYGNGLGLRATIEATLPNGGAVDVLLEGQSLRVAFEIADSSPLEQEVRNIAKAIEEGILRIVVVSDDADHLANIREMALVEEINIAEIAFLTTSAVADWFSSLGMTLSSYEVASRGYKVRVSHSSLTEEERYERLAAIHRAVAAHQGSSTNDPTRKE